jgi:hypothetical protein
MNQIEDLPSVREELIKLRNDFLEEEKSYAASKEILCVQTIKSCIDRNMDTIKSSAREGRDTCEIGFGSEDVSIWQNHVPDADDECWVNALNSMSLRYRGLDIYISIYPGNFMRSFTTLCIF